MEWIEPSSVISSGVVVPDVDDWGCLENRPWYQSSKLVYQNIDDIPDSVADEHAWVVGHEWLYKEYTF